MAHFVDRRLNPKDKSLGNRRRFLKRVRAQVKKAVNETVNKRRVADVDRGESVSIPADGISEPSFHYAREGGRRERVFTGNKDYRAGDRIDKPRSGGGGRGRQGAAEGEGEDDFLFVLSRDEFLDIFFEDLELPDLIKRSLKEIKTTRTQRAGFTVTGSPANISVKRTMSNALGRRLALNRPSEREVRDLREQIFALEKVSRPTKKQREELKRLHDELETMLRRQRVIGYIDPLDVRYNYFVQKPEPNAKAVMFCLMDVSASMGEREKELAKRFFVLLHLFLSRRYDKIELVFIRHTHDASEVDEDTFFYSRETGGTVVSTALVEMKKIVDQRYPASEWNIYAAQASDGENFSGDSARCADLLLSQLMPLCQYFAYIEIVDEEEARLINSEANGMELWRAYRGVAAKLGNFAMKRIARPADIYPVFRELFARRSEGAENG
ncbi:YeaH/YhbH family protein [Rhizobiales bacterium]|uniref:YeaH/YhbH family protein n=1 Tax=Hongsoonwoonella zoysiae TaxID=2821844 RepID=UPI0015611146|nr:YeaH/YhbH family protein [Hongsoonwoonella zoysiae]NRG19979.1 YeaH/YhbH family protein [Hongsoonwoonella zoysiae]